MQKNKFFKILSFFIFPAIVYIIANFLDIFINLFETIFWLDDLFHFIGGFSVGYMSILFLRYFNKENSVVIRNRFIYMLVVVSAVSLIAVLWEFYEFILVNYFGVNWSMEFEDTLMDLFFGICGGIASVGIFKKN